MTGAEQLLEVCRRTIDPRAATVRWHGTRVLRAATRLGEVIVKLHHRTERHQQELHAYQHWVSALGNRAPRLLAATDGPPRLWSPPCRAGYWLTVASAPLLNVTLIARQEPSSATSTPPAHPGTCPT